MPAGHRTIQLRRGASVLTAGALVFALAACGGDPLPATVVEDSVADVAWPGSLTTLNTATASGVVPGDLDVSALTRSQFATTTEGVVTPDASFGETTILSEGDDAFTVRYDLAEPQWSDSIPLDAADLLLAWAAGSDQGDAGFDSAATGLTRSEGVPMYDEFERRIDVTFDRPVDDWQTALEVAVPAHVAGQLAFDIDDPMVAKQAVVDAIESGSAGRLQKLAGAWNDAFDLADGAAPDSAAAVSSGPYRIESAVGSAKDGEQRVTLVVNTTYAGELPGTYHRIVLHQDRRDDLLDRVGSDYDVVQLPPTEADFVQVRDLQRDDYGMYAGSSGQMWALYARSDSGPMSDQAARSAFLQAVPTSELIETAGGDWASSYVPTSAMVFAPGSDGYDIALEDSGFESAFASGDEPAELREAAGVRENTGICVLYDTDSAFARGAFSAIRTAAAEAGWFARDCGSPSPQEVVDVDGEYDILLAQTDVPSAPADLARRWGDGDGNPTHATSEERDALIAQLSRTTDPYDARDTRVAIEKTIVDQRVALPLAMEPVVIVSGRDIDGVLASQGDPGALLSNPRDWVPAGSAPPGS